MNINFALIENIPCFLILLPALKSLKVLFRLNAPQSIQPLGKGIYRRILQKESFKSAFFFEDLQVYNKNQWPNIFSETSHKFC